MSDEPTPDEKTEEPSQRRRDEYRERGEVAKSQELVAGIMLLAGTAALWVTSSYASGRLSAVFSEVWRRLDESERLVTRPLAMLATVGMPVASALAPTFAILMVFAVIAHMSQTGPMFSWKALEPKFHKLDPLSGLQRIFLSKDTLISLLKTLAKVVLIGAVAAGAVSVMADQINRLVWQDAAEFGKYMERVSVAPLMVSGVIMVLVGIADFIWQRHRMEQRMKMTLQESKREHKENEGDPLFRSRRAQKHREMVSINKMITKIPEATVIINNPTHVSVALRYRPEDGAPIVVAKGIDFKAMRIREVAEQHKIPMVTNPPLARALHKSVPEGKPIPPSLYKAVAEVLAFIWKQQGRGRKRPS